MYYISPETPSPRTAEPTQTGADGGTLHECDWCGRAVHRETAFPHVRQGADGADVVLVCAECELGAD